MKKISKYLFTLLFAFVVYYFVLPPINLSSPLFYVYLFLVLGFYIFYSSMSKLSINIIGKNFKKTFRPETLLVTSFIFVIGFIIMINFVLSPLFQSKQYYNRITINEDGNFKEDISEVDTKALPLLDKDSSSKLGDRVMGQMTDLVSQFSVSNLYTQINYKNDIIRVTPLEYNGFIKYLANRKNGVPAYITVNSVNGNTELVKLENGMQYIPSAYFSYDLDRKLRFSYPFDIFGEKSFEIDNDGNPYWIVPVMKYSGVGLRRDVKEVIILNAITGEHVKYDVKDVPSWVDHVYSASLILEQVDDWGLYKNGFLNSLFAQKNVVMTTDGYNYTVMNDDVYLYTGITSVANDESNIGFILSNLRTKETVFYPVSGAEEYSAMSSALGQVQQMDYEASFPLLINVNNKPTYLISLKDNAGLVKMYALVDVVDYQKVVVTDSSLGIDKAISNYIGDDYTIDNVQTATITVADIKNVVIEGNTYYYLIDTEGNRYKVKISVDANGLPFVGKDSVLSIQYRSSDINEIVKIVG